LDKELHKRLIDLDTTVSAIAARIGRNRCNISRHLNGHFAASANPRSLQTRKLISNVLGFDITPFVTRKLKPRRKPHASR